jgi:hypothetical protein
VAWVKESFTGYYLRWALGPWLGRGMPRPYLVSPHPALY